MRRRFRATGVGLAGGPFSLKPRGAPADSAGMEALRQELEAFPDLSIESGPDGIRVLAADAEGADVTIAHDRRARRYVVAMADWHETFTDEAEARAHFLLALSPLARIECTDIGRRCAEAELQVADALGEWQPVSLHMRRRPFDLTLGARRHRHISNAHIPADSPILMEASRALTAAPTPDSPVVIEADVAPLDRPLARIKIGAIGGAVAGAALAGTLLASQPALVAGAICAAAGACVALALPPVAPWSRIRFTGADIELMRRRSGATVTIPAREVEMVGGEVAIDMDRKQVFAPRVVRLVSGGTAHVMRLSPIDAAACFTVACRVCAGAVRINFDGWSQPPAAGGGRTLPAEIVASERSRRWRRDLRFVICFGGMSLVGLLTAIAAAIANQKSMVLGAICCAIFAGLTATALSRATAQRRRLTLAASIDAQPERKLAA